MTIEDLYRLDETHLFAGSTAHTFVCDFYFDSRHSCDFDADFRCKIRQHPPETAAGTAVADGQKFAARTDVQPDCIQFVPPDEVDQSCFTTESHVFFGLFSGHLASELWVNVHGCLSQKKTPQINGIILATDRITADAEVHDPVVVRLLDEVFYDLGGEYHAAWHSDCAVYGNDLIFGKVDDVITLEEQKIHDFTQEWYPGQSRQEESLREPLFDEVREPH